MIKKIYFVIFLILFSADSAMCESQIATNSIDSLTSIIWERTFGDRAIVYRNELISINANTNDLIVGGYSEVSTKDISQEEGVWIWKINDAGSKICDVNIKTINIGRITYNLNNIQSMIVGDNGTILLIVSTTKSAVLLIKINFNGEILLSKSIGETKSIFKTISLSGNNFLLIGEDGGYPVFTKIDETGKELWSKGSSRNKYGKFFDGIATKDGGFLLVENAGASSDINADTTDIFIVKYNADGEKQNEKHLSGKYGNIKIGRNDNVAIVYDKSLSNAQDVWLQVYDNNLVPMWSTSIASAILEMGNYRMSLLLNGSYVVVGDQAGIFKPSVSYIDQFGNKIWTYLSKQPEYGLGTDIVCADTSCYLVYSIDTLLTEDAKASKIKVIRFQPQVTGVVN